MWQIQKEKLRSQKVDISVLKLYYLIVLFELIQSNGKIQEGGVVCFQ